MRALPSLLQSGFFGVRLAYVRFDRDYFPPLNTPTFWEGVSLHRGFLETPGARGRGGDAPGCGLASFANRPSKGVVVAILVPPLSQYGTFCSVFFTHLANFTLVLAFGNGGEGYVFEENDG